MDRNNSEKVGYRLTFDYHTHTRYSRRNHGKSTIEENVVAAIERGLSEIAISDHGPGHTLFGMDWQKIGVMKAEINRLRAKYPQIKIRFAVEANFMDGTRLGKHLDVDEMLYREFDFVNAGYHMGMTGCHAAQNWLWVKGLCRGKKFTEKLRARNTEMTLAALRENDIKIMTHPGDKGPLDMDAVSRLCEEKGILMEINAWHSHMTAEEIRTAAAYDVRFVIGSDAHSADRVGTLGNAVARAVEAGLDLSRIVNLEVIEQ